MKPGSIRLHSFEMRVARTIRKFAMLREGDHVVVAVSGGADSMALLHCLVRLAPRFRLQLTVAHLNHGIRGAEADADQQFVRQACRDLGLSFVTETIEIGRMGAGGNVEALARRARYGFLRRTTAALHAQRIAVGHTMNDQAETVLLHVFRGSGPGGLAAIHPVVDDLIVRPLLECTRPQVARYLQGLGVTCCEDSTNRNMDYRRNRARNELMPYLESRFNPRLVEALARQAELSREVSDYLETSARQAYEAERRVLPGSITIPADTISALHPALRGLVVRQAILELRGSLAGISARHVEDILRLCGKKAGGRQILLPGGVTALLEFGQLLIVWRAAEAAERFCRDLPVPGLCSVPEIGVRLVASIKQPPEGSAKAGEVSRRALLDSEAVPEVLTVRTRMPGDRYGGPGHRKVKKMLIDARLPRAVRDRLAVVAAGDAVIWIPGFRPAKSFAVRPNSSRCIELRVEDL